MTNIEILEKWAKFSEYDPEQKTFYFGSISYETRRGNERMSNIADNYDPTGAICVLYAKYMFENFIKDVKTSFYDLFKHPDDYADIREMWDIFNSDAIIEAENTLVHRLNDLVCKVIKTTQLGEIDWDNEKDKLFRAMLNTIESLDKCHYDLYLKGGDVGKISNISTHIHIFSNIAQCLLTLEGSADGLYLCYIDNNQSASGFFGFFIKSNGNIFSVNERLIEAYAGQHRNHRNTRYAKDKQYRLFPYEFIFKFTEFDYKGYATKHIIEDDKLAFFELGSDVYLPILFAMMLIIRRFENTALTNLPQTYVDALMPVNYRLESGKDNQLIAINGSQLIIQNEINIEFTSKGILENEYGAEFTHSRNKERDESNRRAYFETGQFDGYNQIFVETYGQGFEFKSDEVFKRSTHIKLPPTERGWSKNSCNEKLELDHTPNDQLIGTKDYMRLQAYYQARQQLADYITTNMEIEFDKFGRDTMRTWFPEQARLHKDKLELLILESEAHGLFSEPQRQWSYITIDDITFKLFKNIDWRGPERDDYLIPYTKILNARKDEHNYTGFLCNYTGKTATVWYTIELPHWKSIEWVLGEVPTILKGYTKGGLDGFVMGNPILSVVDPVSKIITPFQSRGSYTYDQYRYDFCVAIGFTKTALKSLLKSHNKKYEVKEVNTQTYTFI